MGSWELACTKKRHTTQTFLARSSKTILTAMKNEVLKLSQGKEEGRIEVNVLPNEERHKGKVLRAIALKRETWRTCLNHQGTLLFLNVGGMTAT